MVGGLAGCCTDVVVRHGWREKVWKVVILLEREERLFVNLPAVEGNAVCECHACQDRGDKKD